ncbi:MAG: hypothetical protein Q8Q33_05180 [Chlamydiota bacterium]|nr:hypothetical protein [Chlamydiota bacterium]
MNIYRFFEKTWEDKKRFYSLPILMADIFGKLLLGIGLGAVFASYLEDIAVILIICAIAIIASIKIWLIYKK